MHRAPPRLLVGVIIAFPPILILAAGTAGYAWDEWRGVGVALVALVSLYVAHRLGGRLHARGSGHAVSALPIAMVSALVGYTLFGVLGLIFLGTVSWLAIWWGRRAVSRALDKQQAALEERLGIRHRADA